MLRCAASQRLGCVNARMEIVVVVVEGSSVAFRGVIAGRKMMIEGGGGRERTGADRSVAFTSWLMAVMVGEGGRCTKNG